MNADHEDALVAIAQDSLAVKVSEIQPAWRMLGQPGMVTSQAGWLKH